ncbi:hypothetical protein N7509_004118 [Penicillium cosmopolitanum]|uniref:Uncharacterized protein n=1 Tax=Penicillium cosmopolitanum TaxID=1131564 RepID=A0A9X0BC49_9EURO|nr:uncharacterized protein N7509_004118 [Penicillium cosmopolitanum]KAJ5404247.1 hypothetical protein N7509_004118 [Penicillium cosmopolitanum]
MFLLAPGHREYAQALRPLGTTGMGAVSGFWLVQAQHQYESIPGLNRTGRLKAETRGAIVEEKKGCADLSRSIRLRGLLACAGALPLGGGGLSSYDAAGLDA